MRDRCRNHHFSGWLVTTKLEKLAVGARHPSRRQWKRVGQFRRQHHAIVQAFAGLTTREKESETGPRPTEGPPESYIDVILALAQG